MPAQSRLNLLLFSHFNRYVKSHACNSRVTAPGFGHRLGRRTRGADARLGRPGAGAGLSGAAVPDRLGRRPPRAAAGRAPVGLLAGDRGLLHLLDLYGAVGVAAAGGLDYLAIYVGPILVMVLGWPLIAADDPHRPRRERRLDLGLHLRPLRQEPGARGARHRRPRCVGLLPYFALQLKAITISFEALTGASAAGAGGPARRHHARRRRGDGGLRRALRRAQRQRQRAPPRPDAGGRRPSRRSSSPPRSPSARAVTFFALSAARGDRRRAVRGDPELARLARFDALRPVWWATCVLSALAFLCLPRQFHVAVVENTDPADVRTAAWAFPLYLVAISLFVLPVAMAGLTLFPRRRRAARHLHGGDPARARLVLARLRRLPRRALGGDRHDHRRDPRPRHHARQRRHRAAARAPSRRCAGAGTANPAPALLARAPPRGGRRSWPLAYVCYLVIGPAFPLAAIGLISFAAVAQFAPALIGGMFWRRGTAAGAIAGIGAGFLGWATGPCGARLRHGRVAAARRSLAGGPFGIAALSPVALGGLDARPADCTRLLWSLGPNLAALRRRLAADRAERAERRQAERFVGIARRRRRARPPGARRLARRPAPARRALRRPRARRRDLRRRWRSCDERRRSRC